VQSLNNNVFMSLQSDVLNWRVEEAVQVAGPCAMVRQKAEEACNVPTSFDDAKQHVNIFMPLLMEEMLVSLQVCARSNSAATTP
jgi:hypothetical protein